MDILYYTVLSPSLLCKYTCLTSNFIGTFVLILRGSDPDIHIKTTTGFCSWKKLPLKVVVFLTVQAVNMVNARNVNDVDQTLQ